MSTVPKSIGQDCRFEKSSLLVVKSESPYCWRMRKRTHLRLFTIYIGKSFGSRFEQLVSKIPYCDIPFGTGVYRLHKSLPERGN